MKHILFFALLLFWAGPILQAQETIQERLGYSADAKLLIIHADDVGVIHSVNQATFKAFESGSVNSASIMVPTPWLTEVAEYAKTHPNHDMGIHLTLTSEWKLLKWGSVASASDVPSLLDANGYFYDNCDELWENANIDEVELELRAQIDKAIAMGIHPTHLDSHMGCSFSTDPRYYDLYLKLAKDYGIPAMVEYQNLQPDTKESLKPTLIIDHRFSAGPGAYDTSMAKFYANTLRNLVPGVNVMTIHCSYDNMESQGMSFERIYWGANWRQQDFDFFTSEECARILEEENIHLVTWKELGTLISK
ncbi:MAG: polysaccharide deacetylase family protein [Allomuricauda sp.]